MFFFSFFEGKSKVNVIKLSFSLSSKIDFFKFYVSHLYADELELGINYCYHFVTLLDFVINSVHGFY